MATQPPARNLFGTPPGMPPVRRAVARNLFDTPPLTKKDRQELHASAAQAVTKLILKLQTIREEGNFEEGKKIASATKIMYENSKETGDVEIAQKIYMAAIHAKIPLQR